MTASFPKRRPTSVQSEPISVGNSYKMGDFRVYEVGMGSGIGAFWRDGNLERRIETNCVPKSKDIVSYSTEKTAVVAMCLTPKKCATRDGSFFSML